MPVRFHHIHLICSDLEKTIAFFTEAFGATLVERKKFGGADGAALNLEGTAIYLRVARDTENFVEDPSVSIYGYNHIGLEVENLQAIYRKLSDKGYKFAISPQKSGAHSIAFLEGPDHISIELLQSFL